MLFSTGMRTLHWVLQQEMLLVESYFTVTKFMTFHMPQMKVKCQRLQIDVVFIEHQFLGITIRNNLFKLAVIQTKHIGVLNKLLLPLNILRIIYRHRLWLLDDMCMLGPNMSLLLIV